LKHRRPAKFSDNFSSAPPFAEYGERITIVL